MNSARWRKRSSRQTIYSGRARTRDEHYADLTTIGPPSPAPDNASRAITHAFVSRREIGGMNNDSLRVLAAMLAPSLHEGTSNCERGFLSMLRYQPNGVGLLDRQSRNDGCQTPTSGARACPQLCQPRRYLAGADHI
jgi:hypothetical protein